MAEVTEWDGQFPFVLFLILILLVLSFWFFWN